MVGEEVDASFGEKRGMDAEAAGDHNAIVLTDRRLLRLSRSGARRDMSFASLRDVHLAEVRRTSRGMRSVWRAALLLAGAGAALATISYLPIAVPLAAALLLGAGYHLFNHVTVSQEGIILFHAGQEQMGIAYRGNLTDQAYAFVNRLFHLKEALSLAPEESSDEPEGPGVSDGELRHGMHGMEDAETGVVSSRGDDTPEEPSGEDVSQTEPHGEPTPAEESAAQEEPPYAEAAPTMEPHGEPTPTEEPAAQEEPPYAETAPTMEPHGESTPAEEPHGEAPPQEESPYAEAPPTMEPHGESTPAEEPHGEAPPQEESEANQPR